VRLGAAIEDERLFAEVRDPAVHFQIQAVEVVEPGGDIEYGLHEGCVNLHGPRV